MRLVLAGILVGLALPALADELPPPEVALKVTIPEAQIIVQTLGAIGCPTVTALATCNQALALLVKLKTQIIAQEGGNGPVVGTIIPGR